MKKYIGNRGTGKTYQLIQEARQNNGIVITVNESQAKALRLEYSDMIFKLRLIPSTVSLNHQAAPIRTFL